jgi:hypothetical protein
MCSPKAASFVLVQINTSLAPGQENLHFCTTIAQKDIRSKC